MKYDCIQYYYSPTQNYPWYILEDKPDDAIPMSVIMEEEYETGIKQGLVIRPNLTKNGFVMIDPADLLSTEEQLQQYKKIEFYQAKVLLDKSIKLESGAYQRKMSTEEQNEFVMWQDALFEFIQSERDLSPPIPEFINQFLRSL